MREIDCRHAPWLAGMAAAVFLRVRELCVGSGRDIVRVSGGRAEKFKVRVDDGAAGEYTFSLLEKRKEGALDEREE